MSVKISFNIKGLKELENDLKLLSRSENNKIKRKAVLAGAKVIRDAVKKEAPVRSGKLRQNIRAESAKGHPDIAGISIRVKGKSKNPSNAYYWRFLEYGTSKMKANPFIRRGADESEKQAIQVMINELSQGIDKVLLK